MNESKLSDKSIREQWDDLRPEEIDWIAGDVQRLIEALVQKNGISRDEAAREVDEFLDQNSASQRTDT